MHLGYNILNISIIKSYTTKLNSNINVKGRIFILRK